MVSLMHDALIAAFDPYVIKYVLKTKVGNTVDYTFGTSFLKDWGHTCVLFDDRTREYVVMLRTYRHQSSVLRISESLVTGMSLFDMRDFAESQAEHLVRTFYDDWKKGGSTI